MSYNYPLMQFVYHLDVPSTAFEASPCLAIHRVIVVGNKLNAIQLLLLQRLEKGVDEGVDAKFMGQW